MADTPQDIQLSRFVRPIGVTGLGTVQPGRTARRLRTISEGFDGVLATDGSAEPGTPPAALSYLTLAPLVSQGLARDERDAGAGPTASAESVPGDADDDSGSATPEGDELRVRELLRDDGAPTGERDLHPADLTVSGDPRRTSSDESSEGGRTGRGSNRGDRSDGASSLTGRTDQRGHRGGDGPAEQPNWDRGEPRSDPPGTVVEQSTTGGDGPGTEGDVAGRVDSPGRQTPSPPNDSRPGESSDGTALDNSSEPVPTTVVHRGASSSEESGAGPGGQTGPVTDPEAGVRTPGNGRGGPALSVTAPGMTEVSAETIAESVSEPNGSQRQSRPTGSPGEETGDEAVAERTIIRSDGRLNDRVFDRLYEEVSRKIRRERDREGR